MRSCDYNVSSENFDIIDSKPVYWAEYYLSVDCVLRFAYNDGLSQLTLSMWKKKERVSSKMLMC